jgi:hypothetical protein
VAANLLLVEPDDFQALKAADPGWPWNALVHRSCSSFIRQGYPATDFVHLSGSQPQFLFVEPW